ncbi:MAG: phosphate acetyltransferase [Chloroflexi bacterium]|nr:phosphate acetyltransferase [Chloroflexota bacterium]
MNFQVGQTATTKRTFTPADLAEYAALTGIATPEANVVPGPLLGGMFSYLLGTTLPGRGSNYLKQHLEFPIPALVGEELTATVEIVRLRPGKDLVNLRTLCANSRGEIVCHGEALVKVKDVA